MNGILLINKPKGFTSHDVVNCVRKKLNIKKVGHTGTLDPNATGVLPILVGQATKISKYLIEHNKTYIATLKFGKRTTTGDSEGEVLEEMELPNEEILQNLDSVLQSFIGLQEQIPPVYSAIKINGKKAYEYARKNQEVEILPRKIQIYKIKLLSKSKDEITFEVECSKGTYIRSLCEDIAKKLGTIGYMKELTRTKVDKFSIEDAIDLENLSRKNIISIEKVFEEKENYILKNIEIKPFVNGVKLQSNLDNGIYKIYNKEKFIGLGVVENKFLKRDLVLEE